MAEKDYTTGIKNIGVYLPKFRLSGKVLSEAWRKPMGRGTKAVPNFDEDSITMAVGAVVNTLTDSIPEALYFASTSAPYLEKSSASLIATAADLSRMARTLDFAGSLRSGTSAFIAGVESLAAGKTVSVMVAAADCRFAEPGSDLESGLGAGAAALELTRNESEAALAIVDYQSITGDITDYWRKPEDRYVHHSDLKYAMTYGSTRTVIDSVQQFLESSGRNAAEFNKVVISIPDARSIRGIAKKLGLKPEQVQDNHAVRIGLLGSPQVFLMLADAAANCPVGEEILVANYGDGCDVLILKKLKEFPSSAMKAGLEDILSNFREIPSYTKYMSYHDLIKDSTQNLTTTPFSSTILSYREESLNFRNHGKKCNKCGSIQTLALNVCMHCHTREQFTDFKLSRKGTINTFTQEYYYTTPEPPVTMVVVDLDGGGRITVQMTDTEPNEVEIDMPVELTFRKLHQGAEFVNYCWKCRPIYQNATTSGGDGK
jgi:3-hydroxy-3-methylglutaryl CoA synthase